MIMCAIILCTLWTRVPIWGKRPEDLNEIIPYICIPAFPAILPVQRRKGRPSLCGPPHSFCRAWRDISTEASNIFIALHKKELPESLFPYKVKAENVGLKVFTFETDAVTPSSICWVEFHTQMT
jgi:hypothetical protein